MFRKIHIIANYFRQNLKKLSYLLLNTISEDTFQYLPLNIGFDNFDLDMMISDYNQILRDRDVYG